MNPIDVTGVGGEELSAEAAFDAFCAERYARVVSAVRLIVQDTGVAQDITQETFAKAFLSWSKLWPEGNPAGWVHRVAVNLAISWRRRLAREARAVARLGRMERMETEQPELHPEVQRAVAALPPRQRSAVALHYVLGLSVEQTAEAMGCRPGTVKSMLFTARERMRKELHDE